MMMRFCVGSAMLVAELMHIALHHRNVSLFKSCFRLNKRTSFSCKACHGSLQEVLGYFTN